MKQLKVILSLLIIFNLSCSNKKEDAEVVFDSSFKGARLDSVIKMNTDRYMAYVSPSFEPVNPSAYFAFAVSSKSKKNIEIKLNYGKHKHRYIPKLSIDKKSWKSIAPNNINVDTITGVATIKLNTSEKKLYVAAQEIEPSENTYSWIDNLLDNHPELIRIVAGKTAMNKNNYGVTFENTESKNAIVLIARQHPPEIPGGTIGFKAFFEELMSNNSYAIQFRNRFNMYSFPLLNPDGTDAGNWRHNAKGVDLNRDWIDFTQPETQMVKEFLSTKIKEGNNIRFAIDFHTSYSGPYMLILDSINDIKTKGIIPKWIDNIEANSNFKVEARRRSQELPYCYNYFYNQIGCEAVTYEEGDEIDREVIVQRAKIYAKELMKTLILKYDENEFNN